MGTRPDEIRDEIEQTREELTYDVDRLADRTVPSRVVERRWENVKEKARGVTDKVMGARDSAQESASNTGDRVQELASNTGDRVQDLASRAGGRARETAHTVAGTVRGTPDTVVRQTRGNPVAAGVVAFGVGLLVASLLPNTDAEKRVGSAVADRSEDLVDQVKQTGRELKDEFSGPAREAAAQVKETAQQAAANTADHARESGRTTVEQTRQAAAS